VKTAPNRTLLLALLFSLCFSAEAQQSAKVPRIGLLFNSGPAAIAYRTDAFRQGLRELGYVEGQNIIIEMRSAEGSPQRMKERALELADLKLDVIVTFGTPATRPAKEATSTIPIVMTQDGDPVGNGFVANLARPGGNITGLSAVAPELSEKRLALLKEILPSFSRVAAFGTSTQPGGAQSLREFERAAAAVGVKVQYIDILSAKDFEIAFSEASKEHADAVLMAVQGSVLGPQQKQVADLAVNSRLPVLYPAPQFVEAGGLMAYSVSLTDLDRRAATYVDKILKGAKAADLPVEQPTKFDLVINLKTAKQIGLAIPPNVLARADRVIK
jgi:ABC-type uncharacterized transport system substrate-binding protein